MSEIDPHVAKIAGELVSVARNIDDELRQDHRDGSGLDGLCYVVSEALFSLTGGYDRWYVCHMDHQGTSHWFLEERDTGRLVDPTRAQFDERPDYSDYRRTGWLTTQPSERTQRLLDARNRRVTLDTDQSPVAGD